MSNFDLNDSDIHDNETPHVIWCAICAEPTELTVAGRCATCADNGDIHDLEIVISESIPPTSPRSIECPTCGADPGEYCHAGEDGAGYNHAARVEDHEAEHGVIAARPWSRA